MTASTYYDSTYKPAYGRLNLNTADGWCASSPSQTDWLQVDLGKLFLVCAVATQGDSRFDGSHEWVTDFKLTYSHNGNTWKTYKDANGNDVVRLNITQTKYILNDDDDDMYNDDNNEDDDEADDDNDDDRFNFILLDIDFDSL